MAIFGSSSAILRSVVRLHIHALVLPFTSIGPSPPCPSLSLGRSSRRPSGWAPWGRGRGCAQGRGTCRARGWHAGCTTKRGVGAAEGPSPGIDGARARGGAQCPRRGTRGCGKTPSPRSASWMPSGPCPRRGARRVVCGARGRGWLAHATPMRRRVDTGRGMQGHLAEAFHFGQADLRLIDLGFRAYAKGRGQGPDYHGLRQYAPLPPQMLRCAPCLQRAVGGAGHPNRLPAPIASPTSLPHPRATLPPDHPQPEAFRGMAPLHLRPSPPGHACAADPRVERSCRRSGPCG
jgi:hypothetical protein